MEWPVVKNKLMTWHYKMPQIFTLLAIYIAIAFYSAIRTKRFTRIEQKFMCWFNLQLCISRLTLNEFSYHLFDDDHTHSVTMFLYSKCRWMELLSFCSLMSINHSIHALIFVHALAVYPKIDAGFISWSFLP